MKQQVGLVRRFSKWKHLHEAGELNSIPETQLLEVVL